VGGLTIRGLQAEAKAAGRIRFQLLVMQVGRKPPEFNGRYEITLSGLLDGKPWNFAQPGGAQPLQLKQYLRIDGMIDHPPMAVVKSLSARVLDGSGGVKATQTVKL
jgi:hypothetical protein